LKKLHTKVFEKIHYYGHESTNDSFLWTPSSSQNNLLLFDQLMELLLLPRTSSLDHKLITAFARDRKL
jgi:hypothetical protein